LFEPDLTKENAYRFSRFDVDHPLSTCSAHPIVLEDKSWLTCEHYFQAKTVRSASLAEQIEKAATGLQAYELAKPWYCWKVQDFKSLRAVLMTRALYTKVQMYDEVKQALLDSTDELMIETSLYDYYWGVGRDQRGENQLGKIWMSIRKKITEAS